jgi:hypothetical protein
MCVLTNVQKDHGEVKVWKLKCGQLQSRVDVLQQIAQIKENENKALVAICDELIQKMQE